MTVHRKSPDRLRQCSVDGCPYVTRDVFCPLHVDTVPDTDHHPESGRVSHRAEGAPAMALGSESMAGERVIPAL